MDVAHECEAARDPRIRRTRHALHEALRRLLIARSFEQISVMEISEMAQVNRATFYDHFADKFALLESLVASRFFGLLEARHIRFDGACPSALRALILAVCDFVTTEEGLSGIAPGSSFQPLVESTVISLIRNVIMEGPERAHRGDAGRSPELIAASVSWAIYGAVKEWAAMPDRVSSDLVSTIIVELISPMLAIGMTSGHT